MIFASVGSQILGTMCFGLFAVIAVIAAAGFYGGRFLKQNEEARKAAKQIARAAALKATRKWLK